MATSMASSILKSLDGMPIEYSLSCMNGIVIALARFVEEVKEHTEVSDEDGLERLILSWLSVIDPITGLKFSKYISTECVDLDLSTL